MAGDGQALPRSDGSDSGLGSSLAGNGANCTGTTVAESKLVPGSRTGKQTICKMHRFRLYETTSRFFLVGADVMDRSFRILKIDRTTYQGDLNIVEDDIIYTKKEIDQVLSSVDHGNKASGGLALKISLWGLLGFIRFTSEYYMLVVTKRSQVAMIGGHYIYQIDGTELISLSHPSLSRFKVDLHPEEARFVSILNNLDLTRSFYFSYAYDVTHTLQHNIRRERNYLKQTDTVHPHAGHNDMFIWNHHLLRPVQGLLRVTSDWCLPIVHGFVDQAALSIYGRTVYITLIARRSRFFAGARYLKRGTNDLGYVANDVETEQIVSEMLTTSFHAPGPRLYANSNYTSYVQHRGSIPLHWTQDSTGVTPKPDIELNLVDPFYSAAALHFDNLFARYGAPVYALDLVKARERTARESILLKEYTNAINYLNQFLPSEKQIIHRAWDMSRASKSHDQDVIGTLESIAAEVVSKTSFFHNGEDDQVKMQNGVARTNCIDCLDRTNAAQFVIGKLALGHQLHALGIISDTSIDYDTDAVNLFMHMYHNHGDTIAIQYGGSHLVNTMETYRKINQWTSHSRDMVESFKRYYHNSFLDGQRQEAYNLFLGNYIFVQGQPMLWDLSTDYYLHNADPKSWSTNNRRSYVEWYTPRHLNTRDMPVVENHGKFTEKQIEVFDDYWLEYYRPLALSSFTKIFSYRMRSTLDDLTLKTAGESKHDLSPFHVRVSHETNSSQKPRTKKGVTIAVPRDQPGGEDHPIDTMGSMSTRAGTLPQWLNTQRQETAQGYHCILVDTGVKQSDTSMALGKSLQSAKTPKDKSAIAQWTLNQIVVNSLDPSVAESEMSEYGRYISHPLNLPLVISTNDPPILSLDLINYVHLGTINNLSSSNITDEDMADYVQFLEVGEDPLTVTEVDTPKKRYKAYRQWLKGKSLFKQSRIDP